MLPRYLFNTLIALDQLGNTLLGGYPDETLSARSYRLKDQSEVWGWVNQAINTLFFWQKGHTYNAYQSERQHDDLPERER